MHTREAAIGSNNAAVALLREGRIAESIRGFALAVKTMMKQKTYPLQVPATRVETGKILPHLQLDSGPIMIDFLTQEQPHSCTIELATAVYNLGLAHQMSRSEPCLHDALRIYDMALTLCLSLGSLMGAVEAKLSMAILNNCGVIHHSLGNYAECRNYLESLSNCMVAFPVQSTAEEERLYLNVMCLHEPTIAGAA
jgi:hypothetical protein